MHDKIGNPFMKGPKIEDLDQVPCPNCGNGIFDQFYRMYKLSALNSPSGKAQVFHVPVFACANCGDLLDVKKIESGIENTVDKSPIDTENK